MHENKKIIQANKDISHKEKVHSESKNDNTLSNSANSKINDDFYHNKRGHSGISPAILLTNVPIVETDRE